MEIKTTADIYEETDYIYLGLRKERPKDKVVLNKKWVSIESLEKYLKYELFGELINKEELIKELSELTI